MEKRFKIIKIIDSFTVLINGGASDDVTDGMVFKIVAKSIDVNDADVAPEDYIDPVELYKGKITVKSAYAHTSLCKSTDNRPVWNRNLALMATNPALNVDSSELFGSLPDLTSEERVIRVGDEVVRYETLR